MPRKKKSEPSQHDANLHDRTIRIYDSKYLSKNNPVEPCSGSFQSEPSQPKNTNHH
jgi:hypothetical protein